jgi:broad specificity phosphatase PhoE
MPSALKILFIRHGETDDNVSEPQTSKSIPPRFPSQLFTSIHPSQLHIPCPPTMNGLQITRTLQGWRDTSLTRRGHDQAATLTTLLLNQYPLSRISTIYHSPLLRIRQTIAPLLDHISGSITDQQAISVISDADLRGQGLGVLEGGSYDSIDMSNPRSADGQEGVEDFDVFVERLRACLGRILGREVSRRKSQQQSNGGGETRDVVVIATHGVGITSLFAMLEGSLKPITEGLTWPRLATRGPKAYKVRWTDSDDIACLSVQGLENLPIVVRDGNEAVLEWDKVNGEPFVIEVWGKREKEIE